MLAVARPQIGPAVQFHRRLLAGRPPQPDSVPVDPAACHEQWWSRTFHRGDGRDVGLAIGRPAQQLAAVQVPDGRSLFIATGGQYHAPVGNSHGNRVDIVLGIRILGGKWVLGKGIRQRPLQPLVPQRSPAPQFVEAGAHHQRRPVHLDHRQVVEAAVGRHAAQNQTFVRHRSRVVGAIFRVPVRLLDACPTCPRPCPAPCPERLGARGRIPLSWATGSLPHGTRQSRAHALARTALITGSPRRSRSGEGCRGQGRANPAACPVTPLAGSGRCTG